MSKLFRPAKKSSLSSETNEPNQDSPYAELGSFSQPKAAPVNKTKPSTEIVVVTEEAAPVEVAPKERPVILIGAEEKARLAKRSRLLPKRWQARHRRYKAQTSQVASAFKPARSRYLFSITLTTNPDKPPLVIQAGRIGGSLIVGLGLLVVGLAVFALVNLIGGASSASNGDNLSYQNSAAVREQERQRLIDLQNQRLGDLLTENGKRQKEVGELEGRVTDLSTSIQNLKGLAKQLEALLGTSTQIQPIQGGQQNNNGNLPLIPDTRKPGAGNDQIPSIPANSGYFDPAQGQVYLNQLNSLIGQVDGLSKLLATRKQDVSSFDQKLASYQKDFSQGSSDLANASQNPLTGQGGGGQTNSPGAPDVLPVYGPLTSPYGWRDSPFRAGVREFHYGIDLGVPENTPVQVTKAGIVTFVGFDPAYGNVIEVTHADGWLTRYAHNRTVTAKLGQRVSKGDIIALSGNTGASTGPHVHYEVHKNGFAVNPANYIAGMPR